MNAKNIAVMMGGIVLGNVIAERFVLQAGPDDPSGFVPVSDGIGMDEVVRAALGVVSGFALEKLVRKF